MSGMSGIEIMVSQPEPGVTVLAVAGEIDMATAERMRTPLRERLLDSVTKLLVLDLSAVSFLASTGIAALVEAAHLAEERGTTFRLVVDTFPVRRALEVTNLLDRFDLAPNTDTALREWTASAEPR